MSKIFNKNVGAKLRELADFEANAVIDSVSNAPDHRYASQTHKRLHRVLARESVRLDASKGYSISGALEEVRDALLEEVNVLTTVLLSRALKSCKRCLSAAVSYEQGVSNDPEVVILHETENLFNDGYESSLSSIISLRKFSLSDQRQAITIAHLISDIRDLEQTQSFQPSEKYEQELRQKTESLAALVSRVPVALAKSSDIFEFWNFRSAMSLPWSFPRQISQMESAEELQEIASYYEALGNHLSFHLANCAVGPPDQCSKVVLGWLRFNGAGLALRIIAGWLRALSTTDVERLCSICYRHASLKSRCDVHATKTHETREGRLGKRMQKYYFARLAELATFDEIRRRFKYSRWSLNVDERSLFGAAFSSKLMEPYASRLVELENRLQSYYVLLNDQQISKVEKIFRGIVNAVLELRNLPSPRTFNEIKSRQKLITIVMDLTCMKGFLRAWFGVNWPPKIGNVEVEITGVDRRHPVVTGASISENQLIRNLLSHRAWMEAESSFIDKFMPSKDVITPLRDAGHNFFEIARLLGVSHTTVRTNLNRESGQRARNRLPK